MKKINLIIGFVLISLFIGQDMFAQLISAADLSKAKGVVIVSARKASDYSKVHIKGAVNVDVATLESKGGIKGKLKSTSEMAKLLGAKGITRSSKIVVYDNGKNIRAGRLFWILKYLGATDVKILNGHMKAWKAARKPLTKVAPKVKAATFTPAVKANLYATKSYVKSKLKTAIILDVQTAEEFAKGHINEAINIDHKKLLTADGKLKSKSQLTSIFNAAGVTSGKEVIIYCTSSARAGIVFIALKSVLKYPKVRGFEDG